MDVGGAQLFAQDVGVVGDSRLGGAVDRGHRGADQGQRTGDVDDVGVGPLGEVRRQCLHAVVHAPEIHFENEAAMFFGEFEEALGAAHHTGVVDQHVDAAEGLLHRRGHALPGFAVADIKGVLAVALAQRQAPGFEQLAGFGQAFGAHVGDDRYCLGIGHFLRQHAAEARACASDDDDFVCKCTHGFSLSSGAFEIIAIPYTRFGALRAGIALIAHVQRR